MAETSKNNPVENTNSGMPQQIRQFVHHVDVNTGYIVRIEELDENTGERRIVASFEHENQYQMLKATAQPEGSWPPRGPRPFPPPPPPSPYPPSPRPYPPPRPYFSGYRPRTVPPPPSYAEWYNHFSDVGYYYPDYYYF